MSNLNVPQTTKTHHDIVIVGSGFSGLGMAIQLKRAERHDFILLEKAGDIGGTWRDNHYPGAACDVPSHMYSFSFDQNPNWTRFYSEQPEILAYMKRCADKYQLHPHIRTNAELIEARWDADNGIWHLKTQDGKAFTSRVLISGIGGLSRPILPNVKGLDTFTGTLFHSAQWNHDYDLTGKRVAVIGTGASAIQFVPQIAPKVKELVLFQRTPPWLVPKPDFNMSKSLQGVFSKIPGTQRAFRDFVYWNAESFALGFLNPKLMGGIEKLSRFHLNRQIKDPVLREKLTPKYTIGCKRVLFSNNYYPALARDNVNVIASGVAEVSGNTVIGSNGERYEVDAIICGTGFDVKDPLGPLHIYDSKGEDIHSRGDLSAYLGVTVTDLPNLFMLLGPNTALGHNSVVFMIESQINYTVKCLEEMDRQQAQSIQVRPEILEDYNQQIQQSLKKMVWGAGGCKSWYINDKGENFTIWPGFTWQYWLKMRTPKFENFEFKPVSSSSKTDTSVTNV
jgi:cation diffusion facilitator CzcD-associated flavoprotein CzcO